MRCPRARRSTARRAMTAMHDATPSREACRHDGIRCHCSTAYAPSIDPSRPAADQSPLIHAAVAIQGYPAANNSIPATRAALARSAPLTPSFRLPDKRIFVMFRWFETRIEAFPAESPVRPPETLLGVLCPLHQADLAGVRRAAGGGLCRRADRGGADGLRRQPGRPDEGRPVAAGLHQRARQHAAVDGRSLPWSPGRWSRPRTT